MKRTVYILSALAMPMFMGCYKLDRECKQGLLDNCPEVELNLPYPSTTALHVLGVYEGKYPNGPGHSIGYHPPGEIDVDVNVQTGPYILALTSYEPVNWNLNFATPEIKENMVGVLLSGYYCQTVTNAPEDISYTHKTFRGGSCNYFYSWSPNNAKYDEYVTKIEAETGNKISSIKLDYDQGEFVIE